MMDTLVIPITLAFDAFAVAICYGTSLSKIKLKQPVRVAFVFGAFQFLMPVIGWYAGSLFRIAIQRFDHWIAFGLLLYIGISMILEYKRSPTCPVRKDLSKLSTLVLYALATSIDALAAGIALSLIAEPIWLPATIAFFSTFVLSFVGVVGGSKIGAKIGLKAVLLSGVALIGIGTKILVEHLFLGG